MIVLHSCLFCLKPIPVENRELNTINPVHQFFTLVQRQIDTNLSSPSELRLLKRLITPIVKKVNTWPCEACLGILNTYNKLYEQMKNIELQTICILDKLGNIMGHANKVSKRVLKFSNPAKPTEDVNTKDIFEILKLFRRELHRTCKEQPIKQLFPIVALEKLEFPKTSIKVGVDSHMMQNRQTESLNAIFKILKEMTSLQIVFKLALLTPVDSKNNVEKRDHDFTRKSLIVNETQSALLFEPSQSSFKFKCHRCHHKFANFSLLKYHWIWCDLNDTSQSNRIGVKEEAEPSHAQIMALDQSYLTTLRKNSSLTNEGRCNPSLRKHCCIVCNKKFPRTGSLQTHVRTIHNQLSSSSHQQNKQMQTNDAVLKHVTGKKRKTRKRYAEVVLKCRICPYFTIHKSNLCQHLRRHATSTHTCTLCNYPSSTAQQLKRHMNQTHTKEKLFKCKFSEKPSTIHQADGDMKTEKLYDKGELI